MGDSLEAERAALRARLGAGARYDSPAAPAEDLVLARRGTAYFARKLNELVDRDLDAPSLVPGWTRRHLVAHVGYHARALTRLADWGRTGVETPMHASAAERDAEIDLGATLPAQALRHLFTHSAVHLNVVWRDLEDAQWDAVVRTLEGGAGVADAAGARNLARCSCAWKWRYDARSSAAVARFLSRRAELRQKMAAFVAKKHHDSGCNGHVVPVPNPHVSNANDSQ
ncbi:maleylpyruvate isomerase N-terminal domain-containing protein [uncultured Nisaea sp.]|uniref:maleylpyruvate isomerase N-terminal domain-containing protein n=1 Tax=uncultured Nisaea sp. TaxID=538215 RepID=UPI0030EF7200|tara:strand:- start:1545 stop:2225 length:681 start_codon:yes stop_codon:yes gene_type:complete